MRSRVSPLRLPRGPARPDELTLPEALDLVRQLAALGVKEVTLIGGEVYLYEGWTDVVREVRRCGMQSSIVTAGRGWTLERARAAQAAGVQSVAFSVDGGQVAHDRLRGFSGAYEAVNAAIDVTRRVGLPLAINTQVNRLSMPRPPPRVRKLVRGLGRSRLADPAHGARWARRGRARSPASAVRSAGALFPLLAELKQAM